MLSSLIFLLFALLGVPLFAIFGGIAVYSYYQEGMNSVAIISEYYKLASQPVLLTIPLFTFAGYLMAESNTPTRLVNVAKATFGKLPGGLAVVTIATCSFFTAFTGASGVTIIAIGALMYPTLISDKYSDKFSMGLVTCCGSLGLLLPPSLPIILYGLISGLSIDKLFVAGLLPFAVMLAILCLYSAYMDLKKKGMSSPQALGKTIFVVSFLYALVALILGVIISLFYFVFTSLASVFSFTLPQYLMALLVIGLLGIVFGHKKWPKNQVLKALREAIWELPLPFLILVGIYGGLITVSEASAVTAFYVFLIEVFIYKDLKIFTDVPRIIKESMLLVGGILIILGVAMGMTNYIIDREIPFMIFDWVSQYIASKWMFLLVLNLFLLVVGCLMDIFSAIIVVVPIITPIANHYGVDPMHLAIVFLTNLEIGYITPPVGLNLFISSFRFKRPVLDLYRICVPYMILLLAALLIITYVPWLSTGLLKILGM